MKIYTGVSIKCKSVKNMFEVQNQVEALLAARFPSFEADGGGSLIGSNIRDIYFNIDSRSAGKVEKYLKDNGFKVIS